MGQRNTRRHTCRSLLRRLEHWLLPPCCLLCGATGTAPDLDLCRGCHADLPRNSPACERCAEPLGTAQWMPWCGACIANPPPWQHAFSAFAYRFPVKPLLTGLKFRRRLPNGRVLGTCMAQELQLWLDRRGGDGPEVIVPVPLHPLREWRRGFNQARELARPVGQLLGFPVNNELARRVRITGEQSGLDAVARRRNLKGAFAVRPAHGLRHVAILDDVVTTGSTARELAGALMRSGVSTVEVWSCARAARARTAGVIKAGRQSRPAQVL